MRVEIKSRDLDRFIRNARRASRESRRLLDRRLARAAEPLKNAVADAALSYGLDKAAAATSVQVSPGHVIVSVRDAEARYARFSGGIDRHPVFGRGDRLRSEWAWTNQVIPPFWQQGTARGAELATQEVKKVLDDVANLFEAG
jgi:hypothetical protein